MALDTADLGFDPDALRERYLSERDRRLRPEGNDQYQEVTGDFAHYVDDPYVGPLTREPVTETLEALVIGGGFGGLMAAARLREAGVKDLRLVEKGGDFGGTWYWNRYPGAQCDVESYIYLPLLEETGYMPVRKYARAPEIYEHSRRIGRHFELYERALFQTVISRMEWREQDGRWLVETDRGDRIRARFVILAGGPLNRPKLPGIPGIETFKGHSFHTSRWDYGYTGGSSEGNLDRLADKRVAIIGTGATAIQCVPHLGKAAKQLYVFQRTPSSVDLRGNAPTDAGWRASLRAGWQRERMENFNTLVSGGFAEKDLVADGWTDIFRNLVMLMRQDSGGAMTPEEIGRKAELADFMKMNQIRARVDSVVTDPATAAALKPWYRQFCKRPTFNDDYLPTFNRPNVTLVDTKGRGVDRVTETGLVFDGVEYPVDCIIFATGFEVGTSYTRRAGFEIHGRNGRTLTEHWADGPRTLHGFYSAGFPNCFHMGVTQNALTVNFPHMLDFQARHVAELVGEAAGRQAQVIEPTAEGEAGWVQAIVDARLQNDQFRRDCTPGYYNGEGKAGEGKGLFDTLYGPGPVAFFGLVNAWKAGGREGLEIR